MNAAGPSRRSDGDAGDLSDLRRRVDSILSEAGQRSPTTVDELFELHRALGGALAAQLADIPGRTGTEATLTEARELLELISELVDEGALCRLKMLERVGVAIDRLAGAGPMSELIERAPEEAAMALNLDRVVLSRIEDGRLRAEALHCGEGAGDPLALMASLRVEAVQLEYPLVEAELVRRRRAQVVGDAEAASRGAYGELMRWGEYVASPIVLEGRVIGFLHGDRNLSREPLRPLERDALQRFAGAFADTFERAVLRRRLRVQRQELRAVASWADARTSELSDAAIDLVVEGEAGEKEAATYMPDSRLRELLTKRELEVLEHVVKGETNADIAHALVVSQETVKFHVKNLLRKLGASNRGEAISRYLRLSMREGDSRAGSRALGSS